MKTATIIIFIKRTGLLLIAGLYATILAAQPGLPADSARYRITPLEVNSGYADWGAFEYNNRLVFISNRPEPRTSRLLHHIDNQTNADFYTVYSAELDTTGNTGAIKRFAAELDSRYNVGPAYISPDGNTLIVTRNVAKKSDSYKENGEHSFVLQLFFYTRNTKHNKWDNMTAFAYNSNRYNCAHAFMTPDGQQLFFSSDMPGTLGSMDIFVCQRNGKEWSMPKNLGSQVNSAATEIFPTISKDGKTLYFSSNRQGGLGGLDIYQITLPLTDAGIAQNMGAPVNSHYDDFGLVFYKGNEYAFFSSNRPLEINGRADTSDNIYWLQAMVPEPISPDAHTPGNTVYTPLPETTAYTVIKGTIIDPDRQPVPNAEISITDHHGNSYYYRTDSNGRYVSQPVPTGQIWEIKINQPCMKCDPVLVNTTGTTGKVQPEYTADMVLHYPQRMSLSAEILFDFDKYELTPEAKEILDRLANTLRSQADVTMLIEGHTDARGTKEYNQILSLRRAKAVAN